MKYSMRLLLLVCAPVIICTHICAQDALPSQGAVEASLTNADQQKAAIIKLDHRISALERAAVLLSKDPADRSSTETIQSLLAEFKTQLETAKQEYMATLKVLQDAGIPKSLP